MIESLSKERDSIACASLRDTIVTIDRLIERKKVNNYEVFASCDPGFTEVEGNIAPALMSLVQNQNVHALSLKERAQISLFVGMLYVRTPKSKKQFFILCKAISDMVNKIHPNAGAGFEYNEKKDKLMWIMQMEDHAQKTADLIYRMNWTLRFAKFGAEIHTSDNPLLLYNFSPPNPVYGNIGVALPGIEIYLPITPYILLEMSWKKPSLETDSSKYFDHSFALFNKSLLVGFADRMLYARSQDVFDVRSDMKRDLVQLRT